MKIKVINLETNEEIIFELPEGTAELTSEILETLKKYLEENSGKFKVEIPEGVTSIDWHTFSGCTSLTEITLPGTFTSIGNSAFRGCTSLKTINIPQNVTSISRCAFSGCTSLETINLPDNITSIGHTAFYNCSSLKTINIPQNVRSIGYGAFSGCTSLTTINIPDSVTRIDRKAFSDCTSLARIEISDPNKNIFHGQSLLHFALEESNSILAINTLLDHGNNIKCQSLPVNLKNHLFPKSKPDDEIDSDKVLKHLLSNNHFLDKLGKQCCQSKNSHILDSLIDSNNSEVLLALLSSHNKTAIDNLVQRCINTGKLQVLHKLIEDNKNSGNEKKKDLSFLEQTIEIRTQNLFLDEKTILPEGKLQQFLNTKDFRNFLIAYNQNLSREKSSISYSSRP